MKALRLLAATLLLATCAGASIAAEGKTATVTASASVQVGESKTKQQAKEEAKKEATRKAVEEAAGTYIQASTTVKNFQLESDEVKSASVAFVRSIREKQSAYDPAKDAWTYTAEFVVDVSAMEAYADSLAHGKAAERETKGKDIQIYLAFYDAGDKVIKEGSKVASGQQYQLMVQPFQRCYLYVINRDSSGAVYQIFPNPDIPVANPVEAGHEYYLPGADKMLEFDNVKGLETFYVIASLTPLKEMDMLFSQIKALGGDADKALASVVEERIKTRGGGGIVQKFTGTTAKFSRKNVQMAAEILRSTGNVVRQINLVHE
ncbi:MAG: DUF4384 domain-containing protein [Nitrospinae bacterium]|nr:DUF4384 domain-containing protein [Nitrospinota bacterium]